MVPHRSTIWAVPGICGPQLMTTPQTPDIRSSPRVPVKVPVLVEGRDVHHAAVREESETLLVNDAGALIALGGEFQLHDRLKITNKASGATGECRVAWRSSAKINNRWSYGVALLDAGDRFWGAVA